MHMWKWFVLFFNRSGRTEEEVLKKAAERFNVAPEKITLKQGELSSYAEVNDFFEAFADCIEIRALLEISSLLDNKTDHVLASWRHSMRSEDQGYLSFNGKSNASCHSVYVYAQDFHPDDSCKWYMWAPLAAIFWRAKNESNLYHCWFHMIVGGVEMSSNDGLFDTIWCMIF